MRSVELNTPVMRDMYLQVILNCMFLQPKPLEQAGKHVFVCRRPHSMGSGEAVLYKFELVAILMRWLPFLADR